MLLVTIIISTRYKKILPRFAKNKKSPGIFLQILPKEFTIIFYYDIIDSYEI